MVKHPCISCVYFDACGDTTRTEPCDGRLTRRMKRFNNTSPAEVDLVIAMGKKYDLSHIKPIPLKDVEIDGFFCAYLPPTSRNTYMRPGKGNEKMIPIYDSAGCPLFFTGLDELAYPLPKEVGESLFTLW